LLEGLIDYAGLYPPASLDMRSAVRNYLSYRKTLHAAALGRFIVNFDRLTELREAAGNSIREMKLSVIAPSDADWATLPTLLAEGFPIDMIEVKMDRPSEIERIGKLVPAGVATYFEVPVHSRATEALASIAAVGARVKLRMGGVAADTFPSTQEACDMLNTLARLGIPFKATAGLHHPIRSSHPLTYEPQSPIAKMHGFFNLCCAATLLHFGGEASEAKQLLDEEDSGAWQVTGDAIGWRSYQWSAEQLRSVRKQFMISFGSCSFTEPMHDLEALEWL